jgi:hypothetical protein
MQRLYLAITALGLVFAPAVAAASGSEPIGLRLNDDGTCGVQLVLKNPDLQANLQGRIVASGWFFIQFQAIGAGAENVKSFTFSFGQPLPDQVQNCSTPVPLTGAYLQDYRGDFTPEDGFFVPINTTLVPDGTYGAAVHAYDASSTEIGRFFVTAQVLNGCQQPRCGDRTAEQIRAMDKILPWPRVLPGDGIQTNEVGGLTIEFAEPVVDVRAFVNGNETPLESWEGVAMDDDFQPRNDQTACGPQPSNPPLCVKRVWGPAFHSNIAIQQNDIVRVVAADLNGNRVEKILHLLDPTQGGIVSGDSVDIDISVDQTTKSVGPGQSGEFVFAFTSLGSSDAHVNLPIKFDETRLEARFSPDHVVVKPGERVTATLFVSGKPGVESGTFMLTATPTWRSGGQDVSKEFPLSFIIGSGEGGNLVSTKSAGNESAAALEQADGTPAPSAWAVMGLVLIVAWFGRRRSL